MRRWWMICLLLTLFGIRGAVAQTFPPGSTGEVTLPNGLRVVARSAPGASQVAIALWVKAGSRNEDRQDNGVAHLLEHCLFAGKTSGDFDAYDRSIEGMGGVFNAETTRDDTQYYLTVPREQLEPALHVLSRMIREPVFDAARLDVERRRASSEVEQRTGDPVAAARQRVFTLAYGGSPYQLPPAGTTETIQRLTIEQIRSFYETYYRPDNATLVMVGDLSLPDAVIAARHDFGAWTAAPATLPPALPEELRTTPAARLLPLPVQVASALLMVGFPAPSIATARDTATMDLLYSMLVVGRHSLVAASLGKAGLLTDSGGDYLTTRDPGLLLVWGFVPVSQVAQARRSLLDLVTRIADGQFSDADLARARLSLLGSYALQNESIADQAASLGFYDAIDTYIDATSYESTVQSLTREDLRRVARQYLQISYTVVMAPAGTPIE